MIDWYASHARALPWREPGVTPWGILVSEFMAQQTQIDRVVPRWQEWMHTWPTPAALADAPLADVLRAWQGLGYPRRAIRLQASAKAILEQWDGQVPQDEAALLSLPGVGHYTAAAVAAFAFGRPTLVLDTNVRRVITRAWAGRAAPAAHVTKAERELAASLLEDSSGASWSAAAMELGALVCTARAPRCEDCPLQASCAWLALGRPQNGPKPRRQPAFNGSDRQARGAVMRALSSPSQTSAVEQCWPDAEQRERALASLVADGLVARTPSGYALPGS